MKLEGWIVQINGKYVACEDKEFLKGLMRLSGYTKVDDKKILKITLTIPDSGGSDGVG